MNLPTTNSTHYFILKDGVIKWIKEMPEKPVKRESFESYAGTVYMGGDFGYEKALRKYDQALISAINNTVEVSNQEEVYDVIKERYLHEQEIYSSFAIRYHEFLNPSFHSPGLDCDGTPTFSHGTINHISNGYRDITGFDLLTVDIVRKWFGWFLLNLKHSNITAKTSR